MPEVYGNTIDEKTRCVHYHSAEDIIAIRFRCCDKYYPCYRCHNDKEDHAIIPWEKEKYDEHAILCGVCNREHTISEYMNTGRCLQCGSEFNEGCKLHHHIYFEENG
ncbi:CHY zinc finger protein [Salinicoccus bachuensis]|uniref:CHY zinc finger protein n=1 Tax=Salinicoccus bachuensis TaxID=3136731 RepID=A0ABZ3CLH9_9STAP